MTARDERAEQVRDFNRFYTREIGVLHEGLLASPFSLTEARILYEIAHLRQATANQLCKELGLDAGYVSRIVAGLRKRRLLAREPDPADRRSHILSLSAAGRTAFAALDRRSHEEIRAKLEKLTEADQVALVGSLAHVRSILDPGAAPSAPFVLRPHRAGDIGWVISRHGAFYAEEYGWDTSFEALVAEICVQFLRNFDPKREAAWIAERDGSRAGCVFLVRKTDEIAQLRLLFVEPSARGQGLGCHLVKECLRFAKAAGYQKITLWTNNILHAARHVYEQAGFQLVEEKPHHSFGKDLVSQTWDLPLGPAQDHRTGQFDLPCALG